MQAFVPKNRRLKFDLQLKIIDLNNVPLVSGTSFVKWHLPHSAAAEHRGRTSKCYIKDHKALYDYEKSVPVRLTVDKNGTLQTSIIHFEVLQEYSASTRGERIQLGKIELNLAEYVDASELEGEEGVVRRYLMQNSKINSTLKIAIRMVLTDGDRAFNAPALKNAAVFGGIAGIMSAEQGSSDDVSHVPVLTGRTRENGESQDLYRLNLAAYWGAQEGELKADELIEDIFAGGDGWAKHNDPTTDAEGALNGNTPDPQKVAYEEQVRRSRAPHSRTGSRDSHLTPEMKSKSRSANESEEERRSLGHGTRRASLEHHARKLKADETAHHTKPSYDVDEFVIRENLCSWKVPSVSS